MRVVERPFSEFLLQPNDVVAELAAHDVVLRRRNAPALDSAIDEVFGWATFLPEPDRKLFAQDLTRTLVGAADVDNFAPVGQLLREWMATAEIHADPALARGLRKPVRAAGDQVAAPAG
jgi:hypothetical protein